jgi:hypothetical protein
VVSPILSNIYLDRLDTFVEQNLVPAWTRGDRRRRNREYGNITATIGYWKRKGDRDKVKALRKRQQSIPSVDVNDPGYRRLRYARYADDHLLGFVGTKAEAEQINDQLAPARHGSSVTTSGPARLTPGIPRAVVNSTAPSPWASHRKR